MLFTRDSRVSAGKRSGGAVSGQARGELLAERRGKFLPAILSWERWCWRLSSASVRCRNASLTAPGAGGFQVANGFWCRRKARRSAAADHAGCRSVRRNWRRDRDVTGGFPPADGLPAGLLMRSRIRSTPSAAFLNSCRQAGAVGIRHAPHMDIIGSEIRGSTGWVQTLVDFMRTRERIWWKWTFAVCSKKWRCFAAPTAAQHASRSGATCPTTAAGQTWTST